MARQKDLSVETLRGIAVILVVMGHVIGVDADGGMKVAEDSIWRHIYFSFEYLRMPLFTVISGWVYALYPVKPGGLKIFMSKKVRRVLLPMVFVGATYFITQYMVPGTNSKENLGDIWKIFVFPYNLFWYLPSLFWVFFATALLEHFELLGKFKNWLIVLVAGFFVLYLRDLYLDGTPNIFSYQGAIYLFPFFIIGIGIERFKSILQNKYLLIVLGAVLLTGIAIQQLGWYGLIDANIERKSILGRAIGVSGTILLFRVHWKCKFLVFFGGFSYTIYLFHAFGTAGGRILTKGLGMHHEFLVFMVAMIFGLVLPIVAELVLDRFKVTRMLFLGRSYNKRK